MNNPPVVVGAGITGVAVAKRLARRGIECVILEAGPVPGDDFPEDGSRFDYETAELLEVDEHDWDWSTRGVDQDWLRVRAAGGRSLMWGGWSIPPIERNLRDAEEFGCPWPVEFDELQEYLGQAESFLNVRRGPLYPDYEAIVRQLDLEIRPKRAAVADGGDRPATALDRLDDLQVVSGAAVTRVTTDADGAVDGVEYVDDETGETRRVDTDTVVCCASPVETARIVNASGDDGAETGSARAGRGLVNHMVASYLVVVPEPAPEPPVPEVLERAVYMPRFVNLDEDSARDYRSGFTLELRGPVAMTELDDYVLEAIEVDFEDVADSSYYLVHALGEVGPDPGRRVELGEETDGLGRPIPVLHWQWRDEERRMADDMQEAAEAVAQVLATSDSRIIPFRDPLRPGGIAHEAGTCRMGEDPDRSVTDPCGEVRDIPGLYVGDASVMPTALERPPTLTAVALALRTADHLAVSGRR